MSSNNINIHKRFYNILDIFCELTSNMSAQNLSLWAHKQIDIFEGIQKEFIAAVFDSLASPTNLPCHLTGNSCLLLSRNRLDTLLEKTTNYTQAATEGKAVKAAALAGIFDKCKRKFIKCYLLHETPMSRLFMNHPFIQSFAAHYGNTSCGVFKQGVQN